MVMSGEGERAASRWPSAIEVEEIRRKVAKMSGKEAGEVRVAACPYRICPLGAHIDHQGGVVTAMTINHGVLLGFVPSNDGEVLLQSGQFEGFVKFRIDEPQKPIESRVNISWESYARGALFALQNGGYELKKGITGFISGIPGFDSSGLSSSAAVGIAYLLAFENANNLSLSQIDNICLDKLLENKYMGLENGILDPSAILLSQSGYLTVIDCKALKHSVIHFSEYNRTKHHEGLATFKILLAFSGLQQNLPKSSGYNTRVLECKEAARMLLSFSRHENLEPLLCDVDPSLFEAYKDRLQENIAKRAEHFFSETKRVLKGQDAWASGDLELFGQLISASGRSSIDHYECGSTEMIQLYKILLKAPGVIGARFSGAGFRGCCFALVESSHAEEAAAFVEAAYKKVQPHLVGRMPPGSRVLICEPGDCARIILPE